MSEQAPSKELCEHDWVGDDFCAYCDADATRDMLTDARLELDELRQALGVDYEPHQSLRERMLDAANHKRVERGLQGPCPNCGAKWASVELSSSHEPPAECPGCVERDALLAEAHASVQQAQHELEEGASAPPPSVDGLGNVRDPDAAARELLQSYFWLKTLKPNTRYVRLQDDHDGEYRGTLSVTIGEDGDAWVSLGEANARFRMPGFGGGASQYTRTALVILAEAIRRDNAEHPRRSAPTKSAESP